MCSVIACFNYCSVSVYYTLHVVLVPINSRSPCLVSANLFFDLSASSTATEMSENVQIQQYSNMSVKHVFLLFL